MNRRFLYVAVCLAALGACSTPSTDIDQRAEVQVTGRMERSLTVTPRLVVHGQPMPSAGVTWTISPAGAATLLDDGRVHLEEAGHIVITGVAGAGALDGARASTAVDVAMPPTIVFSMIAEGRRGVYRATLDGRDVVRLTQNPPSFEAEPTASATHVVFTSDRDGNTELYSNSLNGGAEQRLTRTSANEAQPALSPDGRRLAFASQTSGTTSKVWIAAADASGARRATTDPAFADAIEGSPSWSPRGDSLVLMSTVHGQADLFLVDATTGAATPLVDDQSPDVEPAWSPDGRRVAFASQRDGQTNLYLIDLGTRQTTRLTTRAGTDAEPAWLPDGRLVYVAYTGTESELRWLDPAQPDASVSITLPGVRAQNPAAVQNP